MLLVGHGRKDQVRPWVPLNHQLLRPAPRHSPVTEGLKALAVIQPPHKQPRRTNRGGFFFMLEKAPQQNFLKNMLNGFEALQH